MPKQNYDNIKLMYQCWNVDNNGFTGEIKCTTSLLKARQYENYMPMTLDGLEELAGTYDEVLKGYIRVIEGIVKWSKKDYSYKLILVDETSDIVKISDEDGNTLDKINFNGTAYISLIPTCIAGEEDSDFDFKNSTVDIWVTENEGDEYIATMRLYKDAEGYFICLNNEKEYVADCWLLPLERVS